MKNVNLVINKGDRIGFYGDTGSGKSTFLDLLMGLLPTQSGKIIIDEIDIYKNNLQRNWTSNISHVPQSIFLKEGTILENIVFGESSESVDYDLLNNASEIAQISKFIKQTKDGSHFVGEEGLD